jgi:Zn-dependent protease with chaperone function
MPASIGLLYLPVAVWAATGIGLIACFRRSPPTFVLRLAAAFFALWALLATTAFVWVLSNGGWRAVGDLAAHPWLLFDPVASPLWIEGAIGAFAVLLVGFALNQLVGRGTLRLLRPRPIGWPSRLPRPATRTQLGRFASPNPDAFSFTLLRGRLRPRPGLYREEIILVSDRLWEILTPREREAAVAHELGHVHALDSRYLTFLRTLSRLVCWDPVFAVVTSWLTHNEEYRADRIAVQLTGDPVALARALFKVSGARTARGARPTAFGFLGSGLRRNPDETLSRIRRLALMAEGIVPEDG